MDYCFKNNGTLFELKFKMPNLWKYTSLHSLAYLKLKKVNVFFPFLEAARRGGGWNLATSQENSNKTKRKEETMNPCCQN